MKIKSIENQNTKYHFLKHVGQKTNREYFEIQSVVFNELTREYETFSVYYLDEVIAEGRWYDLAFKNQAA